MIYLHCIHLLLYNIIASAEQSWENGDIITTVQGYERNVRREKSFFSEYHNHAEKEIQLNVNKTFRLRRQDDRAAVPLPHKIFSYKKLEAYWNIQLNFDFYVYGGFIFNTYNKYNIDLYVVRIFHDENVIPGQYQRQTDKCWFGWKGLKISCKGKVIEFLYTDSHFSWVSKKDGDICNGAVYGGITANFQILYVCRFKFKGFNNGDFEGINLGYLDTKLGLCYAAMDTKVVLTSKTYEVLRDNRWNNWN